MKKQIFKIFLIIALMISGSFTVSAQVRDYEISVSVNPEVPAPNTDVIVSISSFATDLDKAQISWSLNGQRVLVGTGKKSFSFRTGESGNPATIDIEISVAGAASVTKRVIIQPGEVDLLWEAVDSYVPPFYKGKALPSSEAQIKVTAVPNIKTPNGVKLKDADFSYNWKRNFNVDQGLSGYAKRSYLFKNSYLEGTENIGVSISSVLGNYAAEGEVIIAPTNPKIVFYENDPVLGVRYNDAITSGFIMNKSSMQITALPYFFSSNPSSSELRYSWSINSRAVPTPAIPNNLVIKVDSGNEGQADISLSMESLSKIFQSASKSVLLNITQ